MVILKSMPFLAGIFILLPSADSKHKEIKVPAVVLNQRRQRRCVRLFFFLCVYAFVCLCVCRMCVVCVFATVFICTTSAVWNSQHLALITCALEFFLFQIIFLCHVIALNTHRAQEAVQQDESINAYKTGESECGVWYLQMFPILWNDDDLLCRNGIVAILLEYDIISTFVETAIHEFPSTTHTQRAIRCCVCCSPGLRTALPSAATPTRKSKRLCFYTFTCLRGECTRVLLHEGWNRRGASCMILANQNENIFICPCNVKTLWGTIAHSLSHTNTHARIQSCH